MRSMAMNRTLRCVLVVTLVMVFLGPVPSGLCLHDLTNEHAHTKAPDIVDTALAAQAFRMFVLAVEAAGLVEELRGDGPYTVFAPTDQAFAKLPEGKLDALLDDPDKLRAILQYHIVPGRLKAADVVRLSKAKTSLGQQLPIDLSQGVRIKDANLVEMDMMAANGVIHVIDKVLMPENDLIEAARQEGSLKTLLKAIEAADLGDVLHGKGPYTLFAPTDEAFEKLPEGRLEDLLNHPEELKDVLAYHLVAGGLKEADLAKPTEAETMQGEKIRIQTEDGILVNDAKVVKTDVDATNGVIHTIDTVLSTPPSSGGKSG
jgi:transforming growth factor-beta-induced protein